ncbi:DEAD/DEAH box helicase [Methylocystis bryophila]|uniref:DEAD-box ATP-dependent RNA helicase RhpA n=1 Tax=Methylocystis bryophila TaxID=655015 RepID=A0A1W6MRP6_9HYPH|nr:DEAD/DEAH box helicase [Methylocystis bryophila]ARN80273.1 DEAD/DEAH box helicase [Methylocystis bryophila]BDV40241.1 RNA helicase [Methylocystis bryophila]
MTFDELGLSQKVLAAVSAKGYTNPTPIQAQSIPPALQGRDILGIAQTGTGKTAAFTLPMLSRLEQGRARARMPRTLILEPTRELAAQVEEAFAVYGANHKLNVALLIGGVSFGDQEAKIMRGADVLIATPGRLLDFFDRGKLLLNGIDILVIDEADRMLDMGFIPDIERVCKLVPFTRQTLFFSATMPPEITRLTEAFLHNPVRIEVSRAATTATTIRQILVASNGHAEKRDTLRTLIRSADNFKNAIIFCNRKRDVAILHRSLQKHGFSAGALHGDMDQPARMASLDAFKNGDVSLIVCSDVAARGLDIPDVSHVFNFDVPTHSEDYVHRIGRTGRAGRSGVAITLVTPDDKKYVDQIQDLIGKSVEWEGPGISELPPPLESGRPHERSRGGRRGGGGRGPRAVEADAGRGAGRRGFEGEARPVRAEPVRPAPVRSEPVRPVRSEAPRAARAQAFAERRDRRPRGMEDDGPPVIGLGDHVPSFLLRPVVFKPAKVAEE